MKSQSVHQTPEAKAAYKKQWRERNRERVAIQRKAWDKAHPERVREKERRRRATPARKAYHNAYRSQWRQTLFADPVRYAAYRAKENASKQRTIARLMADPVLWARYLQRRRTYRRGCQSTQNWPLPRRTDDLLDSIKKLIPAGFPYEVREDLCNDLYAALWAEEITVADIPSVMKRYASKARKLLQETWNHVSLYDYIPGTELAILDTIAHDAPHF